MIVETKIGFLFITILGRSVQCCECCEQSVQSRHGPVQCCPDRHPAVTSMALWDTVQKYPACSAGTRFADERLLLRPGPTRIPLETHIALLSGR